MISIACPVLAGASGLFATATPLSQILTSEGPPGFRCTGCSLGASSIGSGRKTNAMNVFVVKAVCPCGTSLEGTPSGAGALACTSCGRLVVVDASLAAKATPGDGAADT